MATDYRKQVYAAAKKAHCGLYSFGIENVVRASEQIIAKREMFARNARAAYRIGKLLHREGISVPEMHQLIRPNPLAVISMDPIRGSWWVAMEYVPGITLDELDSGLVSCALKLYREELKKVVKKGIIPVDYEYGVNGIYNPGTGKITLIDLSLWRKAKNENIASVLEEIDGKAICAYRFAEGRNRLVPLG